MAQKDTSALLIRPRFTEFHNVYIPQYELDFAIPFLNEDIPLFVDPFLLWKSPSFQDNGLRQMLIAGFNHLGVLAKQGREDEAISQVILGRVDGFDPDEYASESNERSIIPCGFFAA
jgi:hypothetical protein